MSPKSQSDTKKDSKRILLSNIEKSLEIDRYVFAEFLGNIRDENNWMPNQILFPH